MGQQDTTRNQVQQHPTPDLADPEISSIKLSQALVADVISRYVITRKRGDTLGAVCNGRRESSWSRQHAAHAGHGNGLILNQAA